MKYSIALVLLIESINNINGFISPRLPKTLGLKALGARGVSGGGGNKNNPLDNWLVAISWGTMTPYSVSEA